MNYPHGLRSASTSHTCQKCFDTYYVTVPKGDFARAEWCSACRYQCDLCQGEGVIFNIRKDGYQVVSDCPQCANVERRMKLFNDAQLPARYHDKDFGSFTTYYDDNASQTIGNLRDIHSSLYNYALSFVPSEAGVLISGKVGTGKTHLMAAFVRLLTLEKGFHCRFIEFTHLLSELREAFETGQNSIDIINRLSTVPVLFIDELGKGRKTDWALSVIDELISKRYNSCLATFFTTNYPIEAPRQQALESAVVDTHAMSFKQAMATETLAARVGDRIVSRLFEMCTVMEISNDVPDYRQWQRQRRASGPHSVPDLPIRGSRKH